MRREEALPASSGTVSVAHTNMKSGAGHAYTGHRQCWQQEGRSGLLDWEAKHPVW